MQVAVRQFKTSVSNYLALAQQGESIDITSHKRLVARIVGYPKVTSDLHLALMRHPAISWTGGKPAQPTPVTLSAGGTSISDMVLQDR
jgi:antitoxin (DNA-binding transcriptional repressor) of toxin-antitoxin stability system